jgi:hypothetical protein
MVDVCQVEVLRQGDSRRQASSLTKREKDFLVKFKGSRADILQRKFMTFNFDIVTGLLTASLTQIVIIVLLQIEVLHLKNE